MSISCLEAYLAFDFGAESGRAVLGSLNEQDRLSLTEIHRFGNRIINRSILSKSSKNKRSSDSKNRRRTRLSWDIDMLYSETLKGLIKSGKSVKKNAAPVSSIGIDAWGVDFCLIGKDGKILEKPASYRDPRTKGIPSLFFRKMPPEKLYRLTGIQMLEINTVFQLYSMALARDRALKSAAGLLFMPDTLNYLLTGVKKSEFTVSTTSQLLNPRKINWETEIFSALGIDMDIMQDVFLPGAILGDLTSEARKRAGMKATPVIAVGSHDTASAVAAVPAEGGDFAYISSGTWSLVGMETGKPVINRKTLRYNLTNEGGVCGTFRLLKNVPGLWLIQRCRAAWAEEKNYTYGELNKLAEKPLHFKSLIDSSSPAFFNPPDMPKAIRDFCISTGQPVPKKPGDYIRAIMESLALSYRRTINELADATGKKPRGIHIVGGGSMNALLCQFTADATGLPVYAGPAEATAVGNILVQAMALGRIKDLKHLRRVVRKSSPPKIYEPLGESGWDDAYNRFEDFSEIGAC